MQLSQLGVAGSDGILNYIILHFDRNCKCEFVNIPVRAAIAIYLNLCVNRL